MFDCRACLAKDQEIARKDAMIGELQDRLMAMVGERFQTQFVAGGATLGPPPEAGDEPEPLSDVEWANQELERAHAEASKAGKVQPDFAS